MRESHRNREKQLTGAKKVKRRDERYLKLGKEKLNRLLIQQFYEASVDRYGSDSEQAEMLSKLLSPADLGGSQKRFADRREGMAKI
jgi:hypothetical protein